MCAVTCIAATMNVSQTSESSEGQRTVPDRIKQLMNRNVQRIDSLVRRFESTTLTSDDHVNDLVHGLHGHLGDALVWIDETAESTVNWLLTDASWRVGTWNGPMLQRYPSGWRFRRSSSASDVDCCEAHLGQFLYYMMQADVSPDRMVRVPPTGEPITLHALVEALAAEVHAHADLSYSLPVLLAWHTQESWTNKYGEMIDFSGLLDTFLNTKRLSDYCGGAHWNMALAYVVTCDHRLRIDSSVMRRARKALQDEIRSAFNGLDETARFKLPIAEPMRESDVGISYQAHTLEWLLVCVTNEEIRKNPRLHLAVDWLILRSGEAWTSLAYRDLAHVIHALKRYVARVKRFPTSTRGRELHSEAPNAPL